MNAGLEAARQVKREIGDLSDLAQQFSQRPEKIREAVTQRLKQIPIAMRRTYMKAILGVSKSSAIKAKCQECAGWQDLQRMVGDCAAKDCSLYPYRPYQKQEA